MKTIILIQPVKLFKDDIASDKRIFKQPSLISVPNFLHMVQRVNEEEGGWKKTSHSCIRKAIHSSKLSYAIQSPRGMS